MPHLISHPLVQHHLTRLRQRDTVPTEFRTRLRALGRLLTYEAIRDVTVALKTIDTPLEPMDAPHLTARFTVVPILRAGLALADGALDVLPDAVVGHVGLARHEQTLEPETYYKNLPDTVSDTHVLLVDPMIATGGSAVAAATLLKNHGAQRMTLVAVLGAPEGVATFEAAHPGVPVVLGGLDRQLNEKGYILPGLGDAGDRAFGTLGG